MNDCIKKQLDFEQEGTNAMINNVYGKEGASAESVQGAGTLSDINSGPKNPSDGGAESTAPVGSYEPTLQNNTEGGKPLDAGQKNAVAEAVSEAGGVTPDFIVGVDGTVVSYDQLTMSNADFIQEVANIANQKINEQLSAEGKSTIGAVSGSLKHGEAERIVNTYQENIGDRGLILEQSYLNHIPILNNAKGSSRLDVYDSISNQVYDYKFVINPGKGLSTKQKNKIISHGPSGLTATDIHEINPQ